MASEAKVVVANANFGEGWYDYDVVEAEDYATLERQLSDLREKLDWTPISPDNLPKVGDEAYSPGLKEVRMVTHSHCDSYNKDWRTWEQYGGWLFRRPINAPLAAPRGSK